MRKIILLAALGVLASATGAGAQAVISGGRHDLSAGTSLTNADAAINGQKCVFCHTPHSGALAAPLWNRSAPTGAAYQLYTSSTLDAAIPTGAAVGAGVSGSCLSCHDGTIGMDILLNLGGTARTVPATVFTVLGTARATYSPVGATGNRMLSGGPFMGTDLRNDHPITIIYETPRVATPGEFVAQTGATKIIVPSGTGALPLFGTATATATVECASCHNPHNNTNVPFLRRSNANSALCLNCHIK